MKILGFEIHRIDHKWQRQKDLYFKCPKCGEFVKCNRLPDGRTILSALYDVHQINRLELTHTCGGMIFLCSKEYAEETNGPVDWAKTLGRIEEEAKA